MVHVGLKNRSLVQILEKPCAFSKGHIFTSIIMKLGKMLVLIKSWTSSLMGHFESKTRSPCQILEKPCVRSKGHIFSPIIMKVGQNVCLDEISYKNGSCRVKK